MKLVSVSFLRAKLEKLNDSPDLFALIILNFKNRHRKLVKIYFPQILVEFKNFFYICSPKSAS